MFKDVALKTGLCLAISFQVADSYAGGASLPMCVGDPQQIEQILATQRANAKTDGKYDGFRNALKTDTEAELVARLAYSETLAANCPELNSRVLPLITNTIINRIRLRKGNVKGVVYQRNQFSSSFNNYGESRYRDLLCPRDAKLWELALAKAASGLSSRANAGDVPPSMVNYYLYKHSPRFKAPNWNLREVVLPKTQGLQDCVRFFEDPGWK